jgi:predicted TPR repeat methyltransferase
VVTVRNCRSCGTPLETTMVDLGSMPLANTYLREDALDRAEPSFPLRVMVCGRCALAQLDTLVDPTAIFSDYAYFSSYATSWVEHAARYAAAMMERCSLDSRSMVVEIASNDGYLLKNFVARGIPCLGIEPAANVAAAASAAGVPTRVEFFSLASARGLVESGIRADLIVANNVLAHVPELHDFVAGVHTLLAPAGMATFEFPHLLRLMNERQFDTIYHEHYSYFSLVAVRQVFGQHGLTIFDVEELETHGGSLRLFVQHTGAPRPIEPTVAELERTEVRAGLCDPRTFTAFGRAATRVRDDLRAFLLQARRDGFRIAAYGAPAKGNTLLNYCGIGRDLIELTVDRSPHKQGRFLPGSHIPILAPDALRTSRPDLLLILPWNLRGEIVAQMSWIGEWGGRFLTAIPSLSVHHAQGQAA